MSALEDFALGFLTTYQGDMQKKEAKEEERKERKRLYAEKIAEETRRRKLDREDLLAEIELRNNSRVVDKYTRDDGVIVEVLGDGTERPIRRVTEAEKAAAEQGGVLEALRQQKEQSAIDLNRARADNARAAASRPRSENSQTNRQPSPVKEDVALAVLGLTTVPPEGTPEHQVLLQLKGGQIERSEAQDMLMVLRNRQRNQQAKQDAISARLPNGQ